MQTLNVSVSHEFKSFYEQQTFRIKNPDQFKSQMSEMTKQINSLSLNAKITDPNQSTAEWTTTIRQTFAALKNNGTLKLSDRTIEVKNLDYDSLNSFFQFTKEYIKSEIGTLSLDELNSLIQTLKEAQTLFSLSGMGNQKTAHDEISQKISTKVTEMNATFFDTLKVLREKLVDVKVNDVFDSAKRAESRREVLERSYSPGTSQETSQSGVALFGVLALELCSAILLVPLFHTSLSAGLIGVSVFAGILLLGIIIEVIIKLCENREMHELDKFKSLDKKNMNEFKDYLREQINQGNISEDYLSNINSLLSLYHQFQERNKEEQERQNRLKILMNATT